MIAGAAVTEAPEVIFLKLYSAGVHVPLQTWSAMLSAGKERCSGLLLTVLATAGKHSLMF